MRAHEVTVYDTEDTVVVTRWAATAAEAKELKAQLVEEHEIDDKELVTIEIVEIPMDKPGLLEWINELAARADLEYEDEDEDEDDEEEGEEGEEEEGD